MIEIVIPTNKKYYEIKNLKRELLANTKDAILYPTCIPFSAAKNRNAARSMVKGDIYITVDDDVSGFFIGWEKILLEPFIDRSVFVVSARLIKRDGSIGTMNDNKSDTEKEYAESKFVPTACCALRRTSISFDENYLGSGFEDTDYIMQLRKIAPYAKVLIANKCKIIHDNEMKNQVSNYSNNRFVFDRKWGRGIV